MKENARHVGCEQGGTSRVYPNGTVFGGQCHNVGIVSLHNKDGFIYGGAITLQAETYLSDRLVLLLYGRERCLWGGSTGRFHAQYGVGLKIMLD